METKAKENIESLFEQGGEYLETRLDLYKLKAVDKSSEAVSSLIAKLVLLLLLFVFILVLNIGISFFLGELLGKVSYGFFIVAGFYLVCLLVFLLIQKKWIKEPLADKIVEQLLK